MNRAALLAMVSYVTLALMDGELDSEEIITAFKTFLSNSGIELEGEFWDIFFEIDGDLHFIIKKSLLDKLHISI